VMFCVPEPDADPDPDDDPPQAAAASAVAAARTAIVILREAGILTMGDLSRGSDQAIAVTGRPVSRPRA
jgi:hypothetical protein